MHKDKVAEAFSSPVLAAGWIILIFLLFMTFQASVIRVPCDGGYYLLNANFILDGNGYIYGPLDSQKSVPVYERGPIGPLFMAAGLAITPGKLIGPYIIVRSFFVISVILLVLIGAWLFSSAVGLSTGYLVLFNGFYQSRAVLIHLETIYVTWLLLAVFLVWKAFETEKKKYYLFGGIAFGLSYLTSEIPILFLPLPILTFLIIKEYRTKKNIKGVLLFYVSFLIVWLPWIIYLFLNGKYSLILGRAIAEIFGLITTQSFPYTVGGGNELHASLFELLRVLWQFYLVGVSIVAPFWIAGWVWIIICAFTCRKHVKYRLLSILMVPFSMMLVAQVWVGPRQAQALLFYLFSFLTLSILISDIAAYLARRFDAGKVRHLVKGTTTFLLVAVLILMEAFIGDYSFNKFSKKLLIYSIFARHHSVYIKEDLLYQRAQRIANILADNVSRDAGILVDNNNLMKAIAFYIEDRYRLYSPPYAIFPPGVKRRHQRGCIETSDQFRCPILLIKNRCGGPRYPDVYRMLTLEGLSKIINRENITYAVSSGKEPMFSIISKIDLFQPLSEANIDRGKVFKVVSREEMIQLPLTTNSLTTSVLKSFADKDAQGFQKMSEVFFKKYLRWTTEESFEFAKTGTLPSPCVR